jgi:hypothetical protein
VIRFGTAAEISFRVGRSQLTVSAVDFCPRAVVKRKQSKPLRVSMVLVVCVRLLLI